MFGHISTGTSSVIAEIIGCANNSSPIVTPVTLPQNKSMIFILGIGSGGAGGGGGSSTGTGGGGAGGSGATSAVILPRIILPDTIYVRCYGGGKASASLQTVGGTGNTTGVFLRSSLSLTIDVALLAVGGSGGSPSTSTSGGAGGAGGAATIASSMLYCTFGLFTGIAGGTGGTGGASGASAPALSTLNFGAGIVMGGTGGGGKGTTGTSAFNGGDIQRDGVTIYSGGAGVIGSAANPGLTGVISRAGSIILGKGFQSFGGTGGGGSDNNSGGGRGGDGGIGCGGGGGGASSGNGGLGGDGGPGYCLIIGF